MCQYNVQPFRTIIFFFFLGTSKLGPGKFGPGKFGPGKLGPLLK